MTKPFNPALPEQGPPQRRKPTVETDPIKNPVHYTKASVSAIKAMFAGTADSVQQQRGMDWIVNQACARYDLPFILGGVDGQRASDFAAGRMFAGDRIVRALKMDVSSMPNEEPNADAHDPTGGV